MADWRNDQRVDADVMEESMADVTISCRKTRHK